VPRERRAISTLPASSIGQSSSRAERRTMSASSSGGVELEPGDDAEAVAQRIGQHAGARRCADQRERRQVELDRTRSRAFADHDVDLEILQRRVEDFLHHRTQAVDFIDEQHVVRFEVAEDGGKVACALQHRAGGLTQIDPHFGRDDVRQGGLAEPRRTEQQHVVERFVPRPCRGHEDVELFADLGLADVFIEPLRAQRALQRVFLHAGRRGGDQMPVTLMISVRWYFAPSGDRAKRWPCAFSASAIEKRMSRSSSAPDVRERLLFFFRAGETLDQLARHREGAGHVELHRVVDDLCLLAADWAGEVLDQRADLGAAEARLRHLGPLGGHPVETRPVGAHTFEQRCGDRGLGGVERRIARFQSAPSFCSRPMLASTSRVATSDCCLRYRLPSATVVFQSWMRSSCSMGAGSVAALAASGRARDDGEG
jgi:hypothetical protein